LRWDNRPRAKLPENPIIITLPWQNAQVINGSASQTDLTLSAKTATFSIRCVEKQEVHHVSPAYTVT
jgi:hypothetical protein